MATEAGHEEDLQRDVYEAMKVQLYTAMQNLIDDCQAGHGDTHLLWSIRRARHELLKSLSASAGVEYPNQLEWLTDQDRTI